MLGRKEELAAIRRLGRLSDLAKPARRHAVDAWRFYVGCASLRGLHRRPRYGLAIITTATLDFICGSILSWYQSWALAYVAAAMHIAVKMNLRMAFLKYSACAAHDGYAH
ncbi:hypothetical protein MES5069_270050 [Mesorhizobium escarrei]|uniref:Uncharacterized protein n=1 Tax=Mesorhizobium escarrei TaxID=666018 RepID=A0ABM9DVN3_9HYPH|nr:hypothetical protein MES5069_270050 [Mesorhizobium escarrei]